MIYFTSALSGARLAAKLNESGTGALATWHDDTEELAVQLCGRECRIGFTVTSKLTAAVESSASCPELEYVAVGCLFERTGAGNATTGDAGDLVTLQTVRNLEVVAELRDRKNTLLVELDPLARAMQTVGAEAAPACFL